MRTYFILHRSTLSHHNGNVRNKSGYKVLFSLRSAESAMSEEIQRTLRREEHKGNIVKCKQQEDTDSISKYIIVSKSDSTYVETYFLLTLTKIEADKEITLGEW